MNKKYLLLSLTLLFAAFALSGCSFITSDGRVLFGESYVLPNSEDGNVLDESIVVLGGNVEIGENTVVNGDVVVFGGNVHIAGEVASDVVGFGGEISLDESALVRSDLVTFGAIVTRASGAQVRGQVVNEIPEFDIRENWNTNFVQYQFSPYYGIGQVLEYMLSTAALTALAVLVALFLPRQLENVSKAVSLQPFASGGLGCLTFIAVPILAFIMIFTLILIPVSGLGIFILVAASVFGWIAVGLNIGERLAEALSQQWTPIVSAGVGTLALGIVTGGIGFIPCIGEVISLAIASIGLGAVVTTRFGSQSVKTDDRDAGSMLAALPEPSPEPEPAPAPKSAAKSKAKPKSKTAKAKTTKKSAE